MDDDSANWVLVNEVDCAEEAISLNSLTTATLDSDQESDGSISIISEYTIDGCSEEEHAQDDTEKLNSEDEDGSAGLLSTRIRRNVDTLKTEFSGSGVEDMEDELFEESVLSRASKDYATTSLIAHVHPSEGTSREVVSLTKQELTSDKELPKDKSFSRLAVGVLISLIAILGSELIRHYTEYSIEETPSQSPGEVYMNTLNDDKLNSAIMDLCMYKQRSKGEYSEQAVEKCVNKRLMKMQKDKIAKKSQAYMQIKEHDHNFEDSQDALEEGMAEKYKRRGEFGRRTKKVEVSHKDKGYMRNCKKRKCQNEAGTKEYKRDIEKDRRVEKYEHIDKIIKKSKNKKDKELRKIKEKVKSIWEKKKLSRKFNIKNDPNEEWFIKYNPMKNTIEVINVTTLPAEQYSTLIKNHDTMLGGDWYFSLYGSAREDMRKKGHQAEWYFKRNHYRENKRDKAKWYFEYMSARDDTRYV